MFKFLEFLSESSDFLTCPEPFLRCELSYWMSELLTEDFLALAALLMLTILLLAYW